MPIYEFYCRKCNTIFSFFSRSVDTEKIPFCPRCKRTKLERQMSIFAKVARGKDKGESPGEDAPPFDEVKMEKAMAMLASEADNLNEEDPRQAAQLLRKLTDATGLNLGPGMEEALSRMEKGEDPEKVEEEMGDVLEAEDPFSFAGPTARKGKKRPKPRVDETLYDL